MAQSEVKFLALILFSAGSSYGQASTADKAVANCLREAKSFAKHFGGFAEDAKLKIAVFDYVPWTHITWSDGRVFGHTSEDDQGTLIEPIEVRTVDRNGKPITA